MVSVGLWWLYGGGGQFDGIKKYEVNNVSLFFFLRFERLHIHVTDKFKSSKIKHCFKDLLSDF